MPAWAAGAGWANLHDVMPEPRRLSGVDAYAGDVTARALALGKAARPARVRSESHFA